MSEHHHNHHHHHRHQYGLPDFRQLMSGRTQFEAHPEATTDSSFLQTRNNLPPQILTHHFSHHDSIIPVASHELMLPASGLIKLGHDHYCTNTNYTTTSAATATNFGSFFGAEMDNGWVGNDAASSSRWPRQETLTLLEIRSRLDSRFKEANQKGPIWDEVSRIMGEEHGYQRSGKKCREKFENLYKYYKKTREGKAGRQDGKHYRFFRQLEALYGETSSNQLASASAETTTHLPNTTTAFLYQSNTSINQENQEMTNYKHSDQSLSFSNTSEFETSSSENNDDDLSAMAFNMMNRTSEKHKKKKNWKGKVKEFVDIEMKKLVEKQEAWMEKMLKSIEDREQERMFKEEEWTKQESAKLDRMHEFWAKERAWIEARDVALMEVLKQCSKNYKGIELSSSIEEIAIATQSHYNEVKASSKWSEQEIYSLIQIRTASETRFQESSKYSNDGLWEEIAEKMASLGYDRSVDECKNKWEIMRKENLRSNNYFQQLDPYNGQELDKSEGMKIGQMHGSFFHQEL
ncbi:trihelix transcription factor PTL-like [Mercurialis annua]|uniref:trihelix transcription factor PTL-like n=1 Tax=Mercurialis annua TaxID=3986 RepID=UPI00215E323E|nr:trihelix transcription factor PTL-like [Mercurialis annua]